MSTSPEDPFLLSVVQSEFPDIDASLDRVEKRIYRGECLRHMGTLALQGLAYANPMYIMMPGGYRAATTRYKWT